MTQDEVIKEFGRTHRRALRFGWPLMILAFAALAYELSHLMQLPAGGWKMMVVAAFAAFGLGTAIVGSCVCPVCKQIPMSNVGSGRGVILFPDVCPNCGVRLTPDPNAPVAPVAPATRAAPAAKKEQPETVVYYGARTILARNSFSTHMLVALGPFALFLWGPKSRPVQLGAFAAFALVGAHGVYRYFQIDACPSCKAPRYFQRFHRDRDPCFCYQCGAQLIAIPDP